MSSFLILEGECFLRTSHTSIFRGKLDVAVLRTGDGRANIISATGNSHIGGQDIDAVCEETLVPVSHVLFRQWLRIGSSCSTRSYSEILLKPWMDGTLVQGFM